MEFTNAQKLAAVVSQWARPAISQIAASKLGSMPSVMSMQQSIVKSGLVGNTYQLTNEILPFLHNGIDSLIQPMLANYFGRIADDALPTLAHSIVDTAMQQPKFSLLDGLVTFEQDDIIELKDLLNKNLPITDTGGYQVIK